jgi:IS30 family transposase
MKKHHKITAPEGDHIAWCLASGVSIREMARRLNRSPSSLAEELRRNKVDGPYGSTKPPKPQAPLPPEIPAAPPPDPSEKLKLGWSPQQVSGRLKKEINEGVRPKREYINHQSIYQFLYDPAQQDEKLWAYLPRG